MVAAEALAKDPANVSLIEHDNVIQAVQPDGADPAFDERILPKRARCSDGFLDSQTVDPSLYCSAVAAMYLFRYE
jgi:hypothetical protein